MLRQQQDELDGKTCLVSGAGNVALRRLQKIMHQIYEQCVRYGRENDTINYVRGANIGGFLKVTDAVRAHGIL